MRVYFLVDGRCNIYNWEVAGYYSFPFFIIFYNVSICFVAGQVLEMLHSKDRAFTAKGGLIAPIDFYVSTIHASSKIGIITTRVDALKVCNGFDGNKLTYTNLVLSDQNVDSDKKANLLHALTLSEHKGIRFKFHVT